MESHPNTKHILISPLDWGLGHASRVIPLVKALVQQGHRITLAADQKPLALLRTEFPDINWIRLPSYNIEYPAQDNFFAIKLGLQIPKILWAIYNEHQQLHRIVKQQKIDLIISDNRFGLFSHLVPSVFITHQIQIQLPPKLAFLKQLIRWINIQFINQFDALWIPDQANHEISGILSTTHHTQLRPHYLGNLSRFNTHKTQADLPDILQLHAEILVILSGPEPQRSAFEALLLSKLQKVNKSCLVVRGLPIYTEQKQQQYVQHSSNIRTIDYLKSNELAHAIQQAGLIICRSGYSSIMDLLALKRTALLIPTPGQTEQEYLAQYHQEKGSFLSQPQRHIDLHKALIEIKKYKTPDSQQTSLQLPPIPSK